MKKQKIITIGLPRSGTNYFAYLIYKNFRNIEIKNIGHSNDDEFEKQRREDLWKHDYNVNKNIIEKVEKNFNCFLIYKHPYTWVESIYKRQDTFTKSYEDIEININNIINVYNDFLHYWLSYKNRLNLFCIKYETLLANPKQELKNIENHFNDFKIINKSNIIIPKRVAKSPYKFSKQMLNNYINLTIKKLEWEDIKNINKQIDNKLLKSIGYDLIKNKQIYEKHKK